MSDDVVLGSLHYRIFESGNSALPDVCRHELGECLGTGSRRLQLLSNGLEESFVDVLEGGRLLLNGHIALLEDSGREAVVHVRDRERKESVDANTVPDEMFFALDRLCRGCDGSLEERARECRFIEKDDELVGLRETERGFNVRDVEIVLVEPEMVVENCARLGVKGRAV